LRTIHNQIIFFLSNFTFDSRFITHTHTPRVHRKKRTETVKRDDVETRVTLNCLPFVP
jgi:hypothetical protein